MKKITEVTDLRGKRVIVRSSLNVPVKDGMVTNDYRIKRALPTLRYLHEQGAKVIVLAHIGREPEETLKPVYAELEKHLPIKWGGPIDATPFSEHMALLSDGNLLLAENTRQNAGEKTPEPEFAEEIAQFGDIYVNDAFAAAHREHDSTFAIAKLLPAYAGLNLIEEINHLKRVMTPEKPALFMIGGAKFDTKMPLVEKYLESYDHVFVSGALMNDIFKAKGYEVGTSLISDVNLTDAPFLSNEKLLLPIDVVVDGPNGRRTCKPDEVAADEAMMDAGPETVAMLKGYIDEAKTVLWNGPFGNFEGGFADGTLETVKLLAEAEAFSVVGGGDTVAAIQELGLNDQLGFVSTGGGAMLALLEYGTLSTIELLNG